RWCGRPSSVTYVCCVVCPSTRRAWMYGAASPAFGALIVSVLAPAWTTAEVNNGALSASIGTPGVCGYRPSVAQTYQELMAPRSSLPGSPPGVGEYSAETICRTTRCVSHGAPAES